MKKLFTCIFHYISLQFMQNTFYIQSCTIIKWFCIFCSMILLILLHYECEKMKNIFQMICTLFDIEKFILSVKFCIKDKWQNQFKTSVHSIPLKKFHSVNINWCKISLLECEFKNFSQFIILTLYPSILFMKNLNEKIYQRTKKKTSNIKYSSHVETTLCSYSRWLLCWFSSSQIVDIIINPIHEWKREYES